MTRKAFSAAIVLACLTTSAAAQYEHIPKATRDWIKTLKTPLTPGSTCCDVTDGNADILWDTAGPGATYRVRVGGKWLPVPPEAVIGEPNRLGYPVVWTRFDDKGALTVKCFLPGAGG